MKKKLLDTLKLKQIRNSLFFISRWKIRVQNRVSLSQLPDYLLDDIGLNHDEIIKEIKTPFWKKRIY
jgi:uncharacterized protein YjiS (DUF1127 family)